MSPATYRCSRRPAASGAAAASPLGGSSRRQPTQRSRLPRCQHSSTGSRNSSSSKSMPQPLPQQQQAPPQPPLQPSQLLPRTSSANLATHHRPAGAAGALLPLLHMVCWSACQLLLGPAAAAGAAELLEERLQQEGNVPSELSSAAGEARPSPLSELLRGPDKRQVEGCTRRCVPTCTRGGDGAPGLGPLSMRGEVVVFKDGFRSRSYCLTECAEACSLIAKQQQQQQPVQAPPP